MVELEGEVSAKRRWMKEAVEAGQSEVASYYKDSIVFVTGGSGFVGKQLIEKLIRSCQVAKVFILLRAKKGKTIEERLNIFLNEPAFDNLREEQPEFAKKIAVVAGDVSELKIGIKDEDWQTITEQVHFIFHVAASTNFELALKTATLINVRGTREAINLAKDCKKLKCMVYVSTAYTHATKSRIECEVLEDFYNSPIPVDTLIQFAEAGDEKTLDDFMNIFRKEWPNTYTFTKAVAEEAVRTMSGDVPMCVIRPGVVLGAVTEPGPGWLDFNAVFSVSGLFFGIGLGLLHLFYTDMDKVIDFVPVDYVNNATIVAAIETIKRHIKGDKSIKIYTLSTIRNPSDKRLLEEVSNNEARDLVPAKTIWYGCAIMVKNKMLFTVLTWLFHFIPAMVVDMGLALSGSQIRLMRLYKRAYNTSIKFEHFVRNNFKLSDRNTFNLFENLSNVDKEIFNFNIASINWRTFYVQWLYGIKKYILDDNGKDQAYAMKKQFWLRILHYIVFPLYLYLVYKTIYCVAGCSFIITKFLFNNINSLF